MGRGKAWRSECGQATALTTGVSELGRARGGDGQK